MVRLLQDVFDNPPPEMKEALISPSLNSMSRNVSK
jgi:hypothetical protein